MYNDEPIIYHFLKAMMDLSMHDGGSVDENQKHGGTQERMAWFYWSMIVPLFFFNNLQMFPRRGTYLYDSRDGRDGDHKAVFGMIPW